MFWVFAFVALAQGCDVFSHFVHQLGQPVRTRRPVVSQDVRQLSIDEDVDAGQYVTKVVHA